MKLDLGCGKRKKEGFVGVDVSPDCDADIVWDLKAIPWRIGEIYAVRAVGQPEDEYANLVKTGFYRRELADQSVDEVWCCHFFEHLDGFERMAFMNEMWRVMKVGAKATIIVPYGLSSRFHQDPTHKMPALVEHSFMYFNKKARKDMMVDHYPITADFDFTIGYGLDQEVSLRSQDYQLFAVKHYNNAVMDMQIVLIRRE